jgi:hypothetical protein
MPAASTVPAFCCGVEPPTNVCDDCASRRLQESGLAFCVSANEEYVHLSLRIGGRAFDLGARNHNYLLLTLARRRLRDKGAGVSDDGCGWVDLDEWSHDATLCPPRLNLDVFRIRKQFAAHGVVDAHGVIERRLPTRQIRLGVAHVHIARV